MISSPKTLILSFIAYVLLSISLNADAQNWQRTTHVGVETSIGINGFGAVSTDNKTHIRSLSRGAALGVVIGNNLLKARVRLGRYTPTSFSKVKGRLIESEFAINFYPLEFLRTQDNVLDLYITTGVRFSSIKTELSSLQERPSHSDVVGQLAGLGGEIMVPFRRRSVIVFSEILFSNPINTNGTTSRADNAWQYKNGAVNVGVRVGTMKNERKGRAPKVF